MLLSIPKNKSLYLAGELKIRVLDGDLEIFGTLYKKGDEIVIPRYRSAPAKALSVVGLEIKFGEEGHISEHDFDLIPQEWRILAENILNTNKKQQVIMVIGNVDVGKTGLITFLANKAINVGKKVLIIDADTGQSDIGPPTTIGLGIPEHPIIHLSQVRFLDAFFVGATTPAGIFNRSIAGIIKLINFAKKEDPDIIFIDTTGWVEDRGGRELKISKIHAVWPDLIVLIEKEIGELNHIYKPFQNTDLEFVRVPAAPILRSRTRAERRKIRKSIYEKEFKAGKEVVLELEKLGVTYGFFGTGSKPKEETVNAVKFIIGRDPGYFEESEDALIFVDNSLSPREIESLKRYLGKREIVIINRDEIKYLLVAFEDKNEHFLGLGTLLDLDPIEKKIKVFTNVDPSKIATISFGYLKVNPLGEEIGWLTPWVL